MQTLIDLLILNYMPGVLIILYIHVAIQTGILFKLLKITVMHKCT